MSIPILFAWNTVSNVKLCTGVMFGEKEVNLFLMSLTGITIQDGGTRERRNVTMPSLSSLYFYFILYFNFLFYFILLIPNLKLWTSVMSHVTAT